MEITPGRANQTLARYCDCCSEKNLIPRQAKTS